MEIKEKCDIDNCVLVKTQERTIKLLEQRIEKLNAVLEEVAGIIDVDLEKEVVYEIPNVLRKFLDTRGDKAKIVAENKKLIKENEKLAYELYLLKERA